LPCGEIILLFQQNNSWRKESLGKPAMSNYLRLCQQPLHHQKKGTLHNN